MASTIIAPLKSKSCSKLIRARTAKRTNPNINLRIAGHLQRASSEHSAVAEIQPAPLLSVQTVYDASDDATRLPRPGWPFVLLKYSTINVKVSRVELLGFGRRFRYTKRG